MSVRWALLIGDELHKGEGLPEGWNRRMRQARAAALQLPGYPPIYVSGPGVTVLWDVERELFSNRTTELRWWSMQVEEDGEVATARVWFWPDGSMIGVGPQPEDAATARRLIAGR